MVSMSSAPFAETAAFASTFLTLRIPWITVETASFESVNRSAVSARFASPKFARKRSTARAICAFRPLRK